MPSPRHRHGDRASWFASLVREQIDDLHRHVRLVYPYAATEAVVLAAFQVALRGSLTHGHSPFVWLCALARQAAYASEADTARFRQRNAAAVAYGIREVADRLDGSARQSAVAVADALEQLTPGDQELIRLSSLETFSPEELAFVLSTDVPTATALVERATGNLKGMVRSQGGEGRRDDE